MSDIQANETVSESTGTEREAIPGDGSERAQRIHQATERIVDAALSLARLWARHGLTMGKLALERSATTLKTTADLLEAVSDGVAPERAPSER